MWQLWHSSSCGIQARALGAEHQTKAAPKPTLVTGLQLILSYSASVQAVVVHDRRRLSDVLSLLLLL